MTQRLLHTVAVSLLSGMAAALPARSADNIYLDYDPLGRVIPVSSLETFAEDGTIDDDLAPYIERLSLEKRQRFQQVLSTPLSQLNVDIPEQVSNPFALSQWLYSPIGEYVLVRVGEVIQTEGRQNGQQAMRAALILTAAESDGGSLIELIRNYPTRGLRLNLPQVAALYEAVNADIEATDRLSRTIIQGSEVAAAAEPAIDYGALPLLADTSQFGVVVRSLVLNDSQRDRDRANSSGRTYPVDLYLPEDLSVVPGSIPVIVISHGYGDTRTNPDIVTAARKLATNGFAVAVPEHIGSNLAYQNELARGLRQDSFDSMAFVDRPLDIRFLLDTLEQLNETEFHQRLQLERVGMIGHSLGGYTALVAAGATVDVDYLAGQCSPDNRISASEIDMALVIQCRALELEAVPDAMQQLTDGSLADERIGLVFVLAPVSSLFGESGTRRVKLPTVILGGANDVATPVALEQLETFQRLTTPAKYLYLGDNLSHNPELTRLILNTLNPNSDIDENFDTDQALFSSLLVTLAIAQSRVYLQGDDSYRPYLTSSYVETVSEEPIKLHLVRTFPDRF